MTYTRRNNGTCSTSTTVELGEGNVIKSVEITGGCDGNIKGVCKLVTGRRAEDVIADLKGIKCGYKKTSCPDQLALALEEAINNN